MANDYSVLNPGTGGDTMDKEGVTYGATPTLRKRPRVVIGGANAEGADVIQPVAAEPAIDAGTFGLPVRQVGKAPVRLYGGNNLAMDLAAGESIPANTHGLLLIGADSGSKTRSLLMSGSGAVCVTRLPDTESYTYGQSNIAAVSTGTAANTSKSVAYLWHPSAWPRRCEILRVIVSAFGGSGGQAYSVRGDFITAAGSGTNRTPQSHERSQSATGCLFTVGATTAPTRVGADWLVCNNAAGNNVFNYVLFDADVPGIMPVILRPSLSEGFEIRSVTGGVALTTAASVCATIIWREV